MEKVILNENEIIAEYQNDIGIIGLCEKYHVGKLKIKKILLDNGVELKKRGGQTQNKPYIISDWKIEKYPMINDYEYIAKAKDGSYECKDYMNNGGFLTSYIKKEYGVKIPTLYDRREYYKLTGNYWWEQWFDIIKVEKKPTKKCPYCDWETVDVENKAGVFEQHLMEAHNKSISQYLQEYPDEETYFNTYQIKQNRLKEINGVGNHIVCPICNGKYKRITEAHLIHTHNMNMVTFREKYPNAELATEKLKETDIENYKLGNLSVSKNRFVSKYEKEIQDWLNEWNIKFECNRQILIGREIDLLIPRLKIGIEFDGLKWHTEFFGKKDNKYHVNKTNQCNEQGYSLIHIFEDEFVNSKDIVKAKLKHLLHVSSHAEKIIARKAEFSIKEIYKHDAELFLNKFHIQGYASATIYVGGFWNGELVAVMAFKNGNVKNPNWELVRFATDYNYIYCGVAGKMFKYFIKNYTPTKVLSFADRRWTLNNKNNLYTNLGFELVSINKPDYRYYNEKVNKYKRVHKMTMNKKSLNKKYGLPLTMTEKEMATALGYDRIWDCGLFKYEWTSGGSN